MRLAPPPTPFRSTTTRAPARRLAAALAGVVALLCAGAWTAGFGPAGGDPGARVAPEHPALSTGAQPAARLGRPTDGYGRGGVWTPIALFGPAAPLLASPQARAAVFAPYHPIAPRPCAVSARCSRGPPAWL